MDKIYSDRFYKEWLEAKRRLVMEVSMREPVRRIVSALALPRKYTGSFALIPANLDLDRHLEGYPVTDYFFAEDESGTLNPSIIMELLVIALMWRDLSISLGLSAPFQQENGI